MAETLFNRQEILDMANGFRPACIVGAAAELDVWSVLAKEPLTAANVAERLHCDIRAVEMLLDAVVALELLEKCDNCYSVPMELCDWLTETGGDTILPMLRHAMSISRGWSQLAWTVKSGIPMPRPYSIRGPMADRASFIAAMHTVSGPVADDLIACLKPLNFRHAIDVGGASGTWTLALLRAVPTATATIFDLPDAIEQARTRLANTEFASQVSLVAGDFYKDELPAGADFAWVSAICHQHGPQANRQLFAKVFRALKPGGRIAIRDFVMQSDHTAPREGALFAINMLVNTDSGGTFTFEEYAEALEAAGFVRPRQPIKLDTMNSVILAEKP